MKASLPMYDIAEIRHTHDALWKGFAGHFHRHGLRNIPRVLSHDQPVNSLWSDDQLFLSQCCGYDVVHQDQHCLQVLATPWFDVDGCANGDYASTIVVPADSTYDDVIAMAGKVAVINGPESHSGMTALLSLVSPHRRNRKFFAEILVSGSHLQSLALLIAGKADVASVDCVTYELLRRYRPAAIDGTRALGLTYPAPAPPYVTAGTFDSDTVERMQHALVDAFEDQNLLAARQALLLEKIEISTAATYQRILDDFKHSLRAV
jgi:ABC-type phosphate/phosphonate transport system substrate-binding protein